MRKNGARSGRVVSVRGVALAAGICLILVAPRAQAQPIAWSVPTVQKTIGNGQGPTTDVSVSFVSSVSIAIASVWIVPELQPFVTAAPTQFQNVAAGVPNEVRLHFRLPPNAVSGLYTGTVHIRTGRVTIPSVMPVSVNVDFGDDIIARDVNVLSEDSVASLQAVSADTSKLTFSQLPPELRSLRAGQVLVVGVTPLTPFGLLKRVIQIRAFPDHIDIDLAPASLDEILLGGGVHFGVPLSPPSSNSALGASARAAAPTGTGQIYTAINLPLYDNGSGGQLSDQIKVTGQVSLSGQLDFDLHSCGLLCIQDVTWQGRIAESLDLGLDATVDASLTKSIPVLNMNLGVFTVWVGFVPVVFVPSLAVDVGVKGSLSAGLHENFSQQTEFTVGVEYQNGTWSSVGSRTFQLPTGAVTPTAGGAIKAFAGPRVNLLVYGVIGPYMKASVYGEFEADLVANPWWKLWGGLEAGAGVRAQIISKTLANVDFPFVVGYRVLIAQAAGPFIVPSATLLPGQVLRIRFHTNPPFIVSNLGTVTPDFLEVVLGAFPGNGVGMTASGNPAVTFTLFDGQVTLGSTSTGLGQFINSPYVVAAGRFKSSSSCPAFLPGSVVVPFASILNGTIDGLVEVRINQGLLNLHMGRFPTGDVWPVLFAPVSCSSNNAGWTGLNSWLTINSIQIQ